jgi:type IV secretory pathway TraG/TraD family ATPase VirD4
MQKILLSAASFILPIALITVARAESSKNTAVQPEWVQNLSPPPWLVVAAMGGIALYLTFFTKPKKNDIGRARFATDAEVKQSQRVALGEINGKREPPYFKRIRRGRTLWVGMPKRARASPSSKITMKPEPNTFLLPNASEHLLVLGTTGSGKTRFFLNRLGFCAAQIDLPIIAVDLKWSEEKYDRNEIAPTSEVAGFALEQGYEIFTIAPFFPDSNCINPIDLIRNRTDSATANQIADSYVFNSESGEGNIWSATGSKTLAASMLIAKSLKEGKNLAMVQKILARVAENPKALRELKIGQYQKSAFATLMASVDSPETASSVMFSAMNAINKIMIPEITAVFCRDTNIPIVLKPKQMLIFRVHPLYKSVVMPLIAACVENILARNVYEGYGSGGLALLDELPQYYLPTLADIQAVARSKDWCIASGAQGFKILEQKYGETGVAALLENTQTEIIMRISSNQTAEEYSKILGNEDVQTSSETSGSNSSSTSFQQGQRALVTTQQLKGQPTGHALVLSPGITAKIDKKRWVKMPIWHQFQVTPREKQAMDRAKKIWLRYRRGAISRSTAKPLTDAELQRFEDMAAQLLPSKKAIQTKLVKGKL